jgi:hypothetical protein
VRPLPPGRLLAQKKESGVVKLALAPPPRLGTLSTPVLETSRPEKRILPDLLPPSGIRGTAFISLVSFGGVWWGENSLSGPNTGVGGGVFRKRNNNFTATNNKQQPFTHTLPQIALETKYT